MFFFLSKVLLYLIHPFTWVLTLLLISWITKREKRKKYCFISAVVVLLFFSNTVIFLEFERLWEPDGTRTEDVGHYDCAVVLGGMAEWDNNLDRLSIRRSGDRIWQAINLFHLGKVDRILISGAHGNLVDRGLNEARQFREELIENGIPDSVILIEDKSKNTHENAVETKKVLDAHPEIKSMLLITSAMHMRRAKACFEGVGFKDFGCFTTDHYTGETRGYGFDQYFIPNVSTISDWEHLIKEWFGYATYAIMGYF